jgi:hypothetical protein
VTKLNFYLINSETLMFSETELAHMHIDSMRFFDFQVLALLKILRTENVSTSLHFNWELFDHPPYNPDLTLSEYHMFTYMKK